MSEALSTPVAQCLDIVLPLLKHGVGIGLLSNLTRLPAQSLRKRPILDQPVDPVF